MTMSVGRSGWRPLSASTVCRVSWPVAFSSCVLLKLFHRIGERLVECIAVAGDAEPLAQLRNARIGHADLQRRAVCNRSLAAGALPARNSASLALSAT